ncbi:GAF domain-containing protein [Pseudoruegeria sp. SK021]|uniref:GAF domain-containing protein n=1 Tax=Pseudoruegeria sp. SK021 TaxID=1933035 RepID=UPI000A25AB9F|nr:GAF domain-containing protein [Pseudoruegeria sp. SK021]OSP55047.1 diguanylate cyclase [Pseudoruegeria sp. SK021]
MQVVYPELAARVASLTSGETDPVALMATLACEIHHADDRFDWTGFYRNVGGETLKIGPYQGTHGCLVIPFSKGVCGAVARSGQAQIVDDVTAFDGHIACSSSTRSELVLPVWQGGSLLGVLDIDSNSPAAFGRADADALQGILDAVFKQ